VALGLSRVSALPDVLFIALPGTFGFFVSGLSRDPV
jgi:hypothetical protein